MIQGLKVVLNSRDKNAIESGKDEILDARLIILVVKVAHRSVVNKDN